MTPLWARWRLKSPASPYCLLNSLCSRRSKKTPKFRVTGLCVGNSPWPVNYPQRWPVTRKLFPFDDVIMFWRSDEYLIEIRWTLRWRHNERDGVWNHQPNDCLLNRLFRFRSKETSKLRVTGLCAGNSPVTCEFSHKGPVTRKMFPFDCVIICTHFRIVIFASVFSYGAN